MNNAERYRVRFPSITVPANVVSLLEVKGNERDIVLLVPGHQLPIRLKGDDAEAWLAYEDGRIECPPNVNGVRDIIGAYAARVEAKATLGPSTQPGAFLGQRGPSQHEPESPVFHFPSPELEILPSNAQEAFQYQKEQGREPGIDWDRVRKRLNSPTL